MEIGKLCAEANRELGARGEHQRVAGARFGEGAWLGERARELRTQTEGAGRDEQQARAGRWAGTAWPWRQARGREKPWRWAEPNQRSAAAREQTEGGTRRRERSSEPS